jgi:hypothetical protein
VVRTAPKGANLAALAGIDLIEIDRDGFCERLQILAGAFVGLATVNGPTSSLSTAKSCRQFVYLRRAVLRRGVPQPSLPPPFQFSPAFCTPPFNTSLTAEGMGSYFRACWHEPKEDRSKKPKRRGRPFRPNFA